MELFKSDLKEEIPFDFFIVPIWSHVNENEKANHQKSETKIQNIVQVYGSGQQLKFGRNQHNGLGDNCTRTTDAERTDDRRRSHTTPLALLTV